MQHTFLNFSTAEFVFCRGGGCLDLKCLSQSPKQRGVEGEIITIELSIHPWSLDQDRTRNFWLTPTTLTISLEDLKTILEGILQNNLEKWRVLIRPIHLREITKCDNY